MISTLRTFAARSTIRIRSFGKLNRQQEFTQARKDKQERVRQDKAREDAFPILQYPENLDDRNTLIFDPNENQEYITSRNHVEATFFDDSTQSGVHMDHVKEGFKERIKNTKLGYGLGLDDKQTIQKGQVVTFVGLPNAGKSSLLNKIADQELSAVSSKAHTTGENKLYVKNFITAQDDTVGSKINLRSEVNSSEQENIQLVMYDTPGMMSFRNSSKDKIRKGWDAINEADTIVLVVDCLRRINQDLIDVVKELAKYPDMGPNPNWDLKNTKPRELVLVLSKVDLCNNKRKLYGIKTELEDYVHFSKVFITSAETGFGAEELQDYLKSGATRRDHTFQKIQVSEQTEIEILEESVKQALYNNFYEELPHKLSAEINELSFKASGEAKIQVKIFGYKRVHKNMIIGSKGRNIKRLKKEIAKSFMQRYGIPCDVWINVGFNKTNVYGQEELLHYKGNRKMVNENAVGLLKRNRQSQIRSKHESRSGEARKREIQQEMFAQERQAEFGF